MSFKRVLLCTAIAAVLSGTEALAQTGGPPVDNLDLTIRLMPEGATLPEAVTRTIEIPESAAEEARQRALDTANAARGSNAGTEISRDARDGGREFGQKMRDLAQDNRENAVRGERPEPANRPDRPGVPESQPEPPVRPETPAGPPSG